MTAMFGNSLFHLESDNKFLLRLGGRLFERIRDMSDVWIELYKLRRYIWLMFWLKFLPSRLNVRQIYIISRETYTTERMRFH